MKFNQESFLMAAARACSAKGLEAFAVKAHLDKMLEALAADNQQAANEEYKSLPGRDKTHVKYDAVFQDYTYPTAYEWPEAVAKAEEELKAMKADAKKSGAAKPVERKFDFARDRLFSVKYMEQEPAEVGEAMKKAEVEYKPKKKEAKHG